LTYLCVSVWKGAEDSDIENVGRAMEWGEKAPFERGVTFPVNGKRLFPGAILTWEDIGMPYRGKPVFEKI
jgi:hypothetical protein